MKLKGAIVLKSYEIGYINLQIFVPKFLFYSKIDNFLILKERKQNHALQHTKIKLNC